MNTLLSWYVVLVAACMFVPYAVGVRPREPREWHWLSLTIGFLTWLLVGLAPLR